MNEAQLGARVKQLREGRDWDVGVLAYRSGVPAHTIYRIEAGKHRAFATDLAALARALHTSADYLLGITDDPTPPAKVMKESRDQIAGLASLAAFDETVRAIADMLPLGDERMWSYIESYLLFELSRSGRLPPNSSDLSDSSQET